MCARQQRESEEVKTNTGFIELVYNKSKNTGGRMNSRELLKILQKSKMSYYGYSINDIEKDDAYHLSNENGAWIIYYMERGKRTIIGTYKSEAEACQAFHKLVEKYL